MSAAKPAAFDPNPPDPRIEMTLRPALLDQFVGQLRIKERLDVLIGAAKQRDDSLEHLLFCGPPGLGKTSLAHIVAKAMGANITTTSGPVIEKAGDLAGLLTTLQKGDVLFIDEIHRLNKNIEEYLYPAMEDFRLDIIIDQGPNARSVRLNLPRFTLIGATTRAGMISAPLRSRFGLVNRLDYYPAEDLQQVILRSARLLELPIEDAAAFEIARRSRGTPRIANNLLRWVRDYVLVRSTPPVTVAAADAALTMLEIDAGRPRRNGQAPARGAHPQIRRRPGRPQFARRFRRRGSGHAGGSPRALSHHGRLSQAHAAGPRRRQARLRQARPQADRLAAGAFLEGFGRINGIRT